MIKKIYVSELDRNNLSKQKTIEGKARDTFDYKNVVVKKPWGYEYLLFENDFVAIWILHLKKGHGTSMHCHPKKKTSLIVLSGKVQSSTLSSWYDLDVLDGLFIENGVFHTTKALTKDVFVMEIEMPPDKKDLVRLKDSYGREGKGYEGTNMMSRDLQKFIHVFFEKKDIVKQVKKKLNNVHLQMVYCKSNLLELEIERKNRRKIYAILEEKIIDPEHKGLFGAGNIFTLEHIEGRKNIRMYNNSLLFSAELIQ